MIRSLGLLWVLLSFAAGAAAPPAVLVMGDSLSAAYGIPRESSWVNLLQQRLQAQGYPHRVVNGSVTGETTSGGLARLPGALKQHAPAVVLIELGGNDGLRGLPVKELRSNLARMAQLSREAGAKVALFEMRIPANYGAAYTDQFQAAFRDVAREQRAVLVPFFLAPIAGRDEMFQDDGIHPKADAQPLMLDAAWPAIRQLLEKPATAAR